MKLQNLAIIFTIIVIPITLVLALMLSNKTNAVKAEIHYNTALSTATRDGIRALEFNGYNNSRFSQVADTVSRDTIATINTFLNSFAMNLGLGDSGVDSLKPYIPAVAYTMYDGFYVYAPDIIENDAGSLTLEHSLKPYIYYTREYRVGADYDSASIRIIVNYTLDNLINVYIYDDSKPKTDSTRYQSFSGYIIDTTRVKSDGTIVNGVRIANEDAITFYKNAYTFTKTMQDNYGDLIYRANSSEAPVVLNNLFNSNGTGSDFDTERINTIRETIQSALNAAIGNYNQVSQGMGGTLYNFKMPILKATDWDIVLSNISLITFCQGINIGTKYYNGYSVASSFANNYYTPESELCFADDSNILHKIDCPELHSISNNNGKYADMTGRLKIAPGVTLGRFIGGDIVRIISMEEMEDDDVEILGINENEGTDGETVNLKDDGEYLNYIYQTCYHCFVDGNYEPATDRTTDFQKLCNRIYYETYAIEKTKESRRWNLNY